MNEVTGLVEALRSGGTYLAIGYAVVLLLTVVRFWWPRLFQETDGKPPLIPVRIQWLPAYLLSGLTAFAVAFQASEPWDVALTVGVIAALTGGGVAVGAHRSVKEAAGKTKPKSTSTGPMAAGVVFLCFLLAAPVTLTNCAGAALLNNPALAAVVDKAMAWIGLIDSLVSTLSKDQNVPAEWREAYEKLRVKFAQVAVVVSNLVAQGEESQAQTIAAIDELEQIGREIVALLQSLGSSTRSLEGVSVPEPRFK